MPVQPGLAQGDDSRPAGQIDDGGPVPLPGLGRFVGVDADRREDAAMRPGQLQDRGAVRGRRADGHDLNDARLPRPFQDPAPVAP